jgi:hypothetical protein
LTVSKTSYVDVHFVGGPMGGQHHTFRGEPDHQRVEHGGTYKLVKLDDRQHAQYQWTADNEGTDHAPRDGDEASAMLESGASIPEGESITVPAATAEDGERDRLPAKSSGEVKSDAHDAGKDKPADRRSESSSDKAANKADAQAADPDNSRTRKSAGATGSK